MLSVSFSRFYARVNNIRLSNKFQYGLEPLHLKNISDNKRSDVNMALQPLPSVAYLGFGRHGSCHGRHFDGSAKIAWQKSKFVTCSFFNLYFAPHTTINCTAASIQRLSNAIIRACCASTKHCDKTVVL